MQEIPTFLHQMLLKQYKPDEVEKILQGYSNKRLVTLRVNLIKSNINEIKQILFDNNIKYETVNWDENALIIRENREDSITTLDIYKEGKIYLQSLSSMLPPIILNPKERENILDMAAAPGGKTTQIASMTNNKTMITACEKNKIRLEKLKYNLEKQGVGCVNIMQEDSRNLSDFFSFDKILLDAPCSGSGTDNINSKYFAEELVKKSTKIQKELLLKALRILKPGGEMVYSTCSILKEENEDILANVLQKVKAEIIPINISDDIPRLPVNIKGTLCVCPSSLYEGFYVAKIRKIK